MDKKQDTQSAKTEIVDHELSRMISADLAEFFGPGPSEPDPRRLVIKSVRKVG